MTALFAEQFEWRGLSLRQPWCDAILYGGKRIENRVGWRTSHFRGPFLLHAAKGMTRDEYDDVLRFLDDRKIEWRPKPFGEIVRGGIVGAAHVGGVVYEDRRIVGDAAAVAQFTLQADRWWMGAFALILTSVRELRFVPYPGSLGFFRVPSDVVARAMEAA